MTDPHFLHSLFPGVFPEPERKPSMTAQLNDLLDQTRQAQSAKAAADAIQRAASARKARQDNIDTLLAYAVPLAAILDFRLDADAVIFDDAGMPTLQSHLTIREGIHLHTTASVDGSGVLRLTYSLPHGSYYQRVNVAYNNVLGSVAEFLLDALKQEEARETKLAQQKAAAADRLHLATELIGAARRWSAEVHQPWVNACRAYAEQWTALLWAPWNATELRYVAFGCPAAPDVDDGYIQSIVVATSLTMITQCLVHTQIDRYGNRSQFACGAFLDATPIDFDEPWIGKRLDYHCSLPVGDFWINIPSHEPRRPDQPAPDRPINWFDYIRQHVTDGVALVERWSSYDCIVAERIIDMRPEELLDEFGYLLPRE